MAPPAQPKAPAVDLLADFGGDPFAQPGSNMIILYYHCKTSNYVTVQDKFCMNAMNERKLPVLGSQDQTGNIRCCR